MIDFPAAPVSGQIFFASNGTVYQYNSTYTAWVQIASSVLQDATFLASASGSQWAPSVITTWETANPTVILGNTGGWYNAATGVYTPPAGRYFLFGQIHYFSSSAAMYGELRWRKNGVVIANNTMSTYSSGANQNMECSNAVIVDANGTDTFELQVQCSVLMSGCQGTMGAYPVSQQSLAGGSSWRQLASMTPAAAATVDFQNFPSDINHLMFNFDVMPSTNTHDFGVQFYNGSGTLITANYAWSNTAAAHTLAGTSPVAVGSAGVGLTSMLAFDYPVVNRVVGNVSGIRGRGEMRHIRDATRVKSLSQQNDYVSDDGAVFLSLYGSGYNSGVMAVTGLRFLWNPSVNFSAVGNITLWGSP